MKKAIAVLGGLALLVLAVVMIGLLLPKQHHATRERFYAATPEALYRAITTPGEYPRWRSGVRQVEMLAGEAGKVRFRESGRDGAITYVFEETVPSSRVVSRIADPSLPFGGQWTFVLTPDDSGTVLRITEDGEVSHPIFRFMSRFVLGHHAGIETYLADVQRHLESAAPPP